VKLAGARFLRHDALTSSVLGYSEYLTDEVFWLMIAHRFNGMSLGNINPGNGTIWLDDVSCSGTETDIALCPHNGWGNHNCGHDEDVSVRCTVSGMTCYLLLSVTDYSLC